MQGWGGRQLNRWAAVCPAYHNSCATWITQWHEPRDAHNTTVRIYVAKKTPPTRSAAPALFAGCILLNPISQGLPEEQDKA